MEQITDNKNAGKMSRKKFFGLSFMGLISFGLLSTTGSLFGKVLNKTGGKIQAQLHPDAVKREGKSIKNG